VPVLKARIHKAILKAGVVKHLAKTAITARKLALTGVRPVVWGHQQQGIAPSVLLRVRSAVVGALSVRKPGGCASTAMKLHGYGKYDPLVTFRKEVIAEFLYAAAKSSLQMAIRKSWTKLVDVLSSRPGRWHRVTGPVSATVATLLDMDWQPLEVDRWVDDLGQEWNLNLKDPCLIPQVVEQLAISFDRVVWKHFGSQHHFTGNCSGLDVTVGCRCLRKLHSLGLHRSQYWADAVMQGSMHFFSDLHIIKGKCPYCQAEGIEHPWKHLAWECPHVQALPDEHIQTTNNLCRFAGLGCDNQPILWLRGLLPSTLTFDTTAVPEELNDYYRCSHLPEQLPFAIPAGAITATDGSGGIHSKDPRLRRCTWSVVVLGMEGDLLFWAGGALPGRQTVPLAELFAAKMANLLTTNPSTHVLDAKYVCRGIRRGCMHQHPTNTHAWAQLWQAITARGTILTPIWIPSHLENGELEQHGVSQLQFLANAVADHVCTHFQAQVTVPDYVLQGVEFYSGRSYLVLQRLFTVAMFMADQRPDTLVDGGGAGGAGPLFGTVAHEAATKVNRADAMKALLATQSHPFVALPNGKGRQCTRCKLVIPSHASVAVATDMVAVPCMGRRREPEFRLFQEDLDENPNLPEEASLRRYGKLLVHCSHVMVASAATQAYFCSKCGAWGKSRSVKLKAECTTPTTAGLDALKRFHKGRMPVTGR